MVMRPITSITFTSPTWRVFSLMLKEAASWPSSVGYKAVSAIGREPGNCELFQRSGDLHGVFRRLLQNLFLVERQSPAVADHRPAVDHHVPHIFGFERIHHLRN